MALPFQAQPSRLGAGTGPDGTATLRLSPGSFHVAIAAIGYTPDTLAITLAGPIDTAFVVMLEREPRELEEVVVSSTRSWRRVEEQPLRVEVLGREEIEEKLLTTPGDISMMLNETGGLRVQTTSGSSPISRTSAGCGRRGTADWCCRAARPMAGGPQTPGRRSTAEW